MLPSVKMRSQSLGGDRLETNQNRIIDWEIWHTNQKHCSESLCEAEQWSSKCFHSRIFRWTNEEEECLCQRAWREETIRERASPPPHTQRSSDNTFSLFLFGFNATYLQSFLNCSSETLALNSWIFSLESNWLSWVILKNVSLLTYI